MQGSDRPATAAALYFLRLLDAADISYMVTGGVAAIM
jgi:hypothetical protein